MPRPRTDIVTNAPVRAFVGIGSNLDDPVRKVRVAIAALDRIDRTRLLRASRLYRTPPWGLEDQPDFVNAVAELETTLTPRALLDALANIEAAAGRRRVERWGPRVLDLDLLTHGDSWGTLDGVELPHPRMGGRAFVLVPLAELAPTLDLPGLGRVDALLAGVGRAGIEPLPDDAGC